MTNTLYYGDKLDILREYIPDELVGIIYFNPAFSYEAKYKGVKRW